MTESATPLTTLDKLKFIIVLVVVAYVIGNGIYKAFTSHRHEDYQTCEALWKIKVEPIGILGYDPDSGVPIYSYPNMSNEFHSACMAALKKQRASQKERGK